MMMDWDITWKITKEDLAGRVIEVVTFEHNGLTFLGKEFILDAILGNAVTNFGTDPYLGVGNGTTVFDPSQTDLQGTVKTYVSCDNASSFGNELFWDSLFTFPPVPKVWAEFAIFDGPFVAGTNFITDFGFGTPYGAPSDPTGGTWELTSPNFGAQGPVAFDINQADLTTALETDLGVGNVDVSVFALGNYRVELIGTLADQAWADWTIDTTNLTGPDAPYSGVIGTVQPGSLPGAAPLMMNRRVANLGTQPTSQRWRLNATGRLQG